MGVNGVPGAWSGILRNNDARQICGSTEGLRRSHSLLKVSAFIYQANPHRDAFLNANELPRHLRNLPGNALRRMRQQGSIALNVKLRLKEGLYMPLRSVSRTSIIHTSSVPTFFRGERAVEAQILNVCRGHVA